jgi:hypothetical protein
MRTVLLLALFHLGSPALAAGVSEDDAFQRWSSSAYTYCDAKLLAGLWGKETWDAKIRIGRLMAKGRGEEIMDALNQARDRARTNGLTCDYWETGLDMQQAELLATFWGIGTIEAKARVEDKMLIGGRPLVESVLDAAKRSGAGTTGGTEHTVTVDSCHTKMLRHLWGMNAAEVQSQVSYKLSSGYNDYVSSEIEQARQLANASRRVACAFHETPYSYDDAQVLAGAWSQSVTEAKAWVEQKYLNGNEDLVAQQLRNARKP